VNVVAKPLLRRVTLWQEDGGRREESLFNIVSSIDDVCHENIVTLLKTYQSLFQCDDGVSSDEVVDHVNVERRSSQLNLEVHGSDICRRADPV
jgi:hypothetical protein